MFDILMPGYIKKQLLKYKQAVRHVQHQHFIRREELNERWLQAGIVSLDLSKSKEQDELKDWVELGFLKVMEKKSPPEWAQKEADSF